MNAAYYNEIDPFAAAWLRSLIAAGHIAPGDVDERSIEHVQPADLVGYTQCHFFAGIGVWSHALRSAGWPDDRPVWTGSCPCQSFSAAGSGRGFDDSRHLWPHFFRLIREQQPCTVFGEQVASKDGLAWLDFVCADLEGEGYAVAPVDLCAAGFGAPHIRQRLYFVADADDAGQRAGSGAVRDQWNDIGRRRKSGDVGHASSTGSQGRNKQDVQRTRGGHEGREPSGAGASPGATNGFWQDADWLPCRDGKARPVEPGAFPLVNGATQRVGRLRGYGNAIVAPVAQAFIEAFMETEV